MLKWFAFGVSACSVGSRLICQVVEVLDGKNI